MKQLIIISMLIFIYNYSIAQDNIKGVYKDYFGNELHLDLNKTHLYEWRFDLSSSWSKGTWTILNDTLYLTNIIVYDTVVYMDTTNQRKSAFIR